MANCWLSILCPILILPKYCLQHVDIIPTKSIYCPVETMGYSNIPIGCLSSNNYWCRQHLTVWEMLVQRPVKYRLLRRWNRDNIRVRHCRQRGSASQTSVHPVAPTFSAAAVQSPPVDCPPAASPLNITNSFITLYHSSASRFSISNRSSQKTMRRTAANCVMTVATQPSISGQHVKRQRNGQNDQKPRSKG